ncbi:calmodulin-like protein 4 [Anneissia japonica]|uniref:calmodulin-like protein 4 n=1 Tax=Anneissia japonica TaxID=1529436 RepID=UPI00142583C6|nr:calmodulin-like protein 4 [Anneissia japonica]
MEVSSLVNIFCCLCIVSQSISASETNENAPTDKYTNVIKELQESGLREVKKWVTHQSPTNEEIHELFSLYDTSRDGQISRYELHATIEYYFGPFPSDEVQQIINRYDTDGDSFVNYREFAEMIRNENRK